MRIQKIEQFLLNKNQDNFCKFYANNNNALQSAKLAGFKSYWVYGYMLLNKLQCSSAIQERIKFYKEQYEKENKEETNNIDDKIFEKGLSQSQKTLVLRGEKNNKELDKQIEREYDLKRSIKYDVNTLTAKQEKYCQYYARTGNSSLSSRLAGYSKGKAMSNYFQKNKTGFTKNKITKRVEKIKKELEKQGKIVEKVEDIPISFFRESAKEFNKNPYQKPTTFKLQKGEFGYLYMLTNETWGDWVKIGMTVKFKQRLSQFNSANLEECKVLDYHLTDDLIVNEHYMQTHFINFCHKNNRKIKPNKHERGKSLEWHNVSVEEGKKLFTEIVEKMKCSHLKEQLSTTVNITPDK